VIVLTTDGIDSSNSFYQEGNEYYEKGQFDKAIDLYTKAIDSSHEDNLDLYKYYYNRGLAKACQENYLDALLDVRKVLELKPGFAEGYYILGLCHEYLEELDTAIRQYKQALQINPDFRDAKSRLELAESKKREQFSQPSRPSQQDHSETLKRVRRLEEQGSYGEALIAIEGARKKDPDNFKLLGPRRILIEKIRANKCEVIFGLEELKDTFDKLVICPLLYADHSLYQAPIVQSSKGMILYGPPGCGKNLFVRVMAKTAGITLIEVVLSEILSMWSGESEKRLTAVFENAIDLARTGKPVMLFFDEVDAIGFARGLAQEPDEASWSRYLRSTFLRLFNEVEDIPNLMVVGATNCFWSVDDSLKRPGRLGDSIMYVPPPDEKTREEMFRFFSKDTPGHERLNYGKLAMMTPFFSGADIKNVCKDAHLEVSREIVKFKRTRTKAKTVDYEWCIDKKMPATLSWTRKVAKEMAGGKIEKHELDAKLLDDLRRARAMDLGFRRRGSRNSRHVNKSLMD
jgi:SpoVK/Ycf46/Vps4 family AAA+-type ATPase